MVAEQSVAHVILRRRRRICEILCSAQNDMCRITTRLSSYDDACGVSFSAYACSSCAFCAYDRKACTNLPYISYIVFSTAYFVSHDVRSTNDEVQFLIDHFIERILNNSFRPCFSKIRNQLSNNRFIYNSIDIIPPIT